MFSFHIGPDLDILFEKLTAQIGARLGLETLLRFEAPGDLRFDIFKMQQLTLGKSSGPLENGRRVAFEKHSLYTMPQGVTSTSRP